MTRKRIVMIALLPAILGFTTLASPIAYAGNAVCTTAICSPNSDGFIDMRRPLNGPQPATACEIMNNPVVDVVIQVVGGILKVKWVVTLVPTLVCRLV